MAKLGYALSSEEHSPHDLVTLAAKSQDAGFGFAYLSDHYHPWIDKQGHSPFVWSVLGAIAQAMPNFPIATGVTCPTIRLHPAIIAQAASTVSLMSGGNFILGLGTGENLNEHIVGQGWPPIQVRRLMLEEAVHIIRQLFTGKVINYFGEFYTVESARIYDVPDTPVPIYIAASGPKSAALAAEIGDGFITTSPDSKLASTFENNGGSGKPKIAQITVCYHPKEEEAVKIAHQYWPNAALSGQLSSELKQPSHFESATKLFTPESVAKSIICSPSAEDHIKSLEKYFDAGYNQVYVHQAGPYQDLFFEFYQKQIITSF